MLDALFGSQGKNKNQTDELQALIAQAREERTMLSAMLTQMAGGTSKLAQTSKALDQVGQKADAALKRLDDLGMKGFTHPIKVTCEDHEGNGPILVQQWDGKKWQVVSEWVAPMRDVVRPKIEAAAVEEGKKLGYTMRDCAKEK